VSGIFGVWRLDGRPLEAAVLERMSESLAHRGPDGVGSWVAGPFGLGHRMLRTTPESDHERQPVIAENGALALTADVRLDNREELITRLGIRDRNLGEVSDADILLRAFERDEDSASRLTGDFAFAVRDAERDALSLARDPFGVKPLYYTHLPGRLFAFASDIEALLTLPEVTREVDEDEVARHLLIPIGVDPAAAYFRQVRKVLPGHLLRVSARGVEEKRYWDLDDEHELRLASPGEYGEAIREAFTEAVRVRLRSRTAVAAMLSGGIDSSSIACVAARLLAGSGRPLHTLSAVYPDVPASDERAHIDAILARIDAVPHFLAADETDPIAEIDRMNRLLGGASWGINLYLNWELFGVAAAAGAGVVLDGFDGDATISHGRAWLSELAIAGRWWKLARASIPYSRRRGEPALTEYLALVRFGRGRRRRLAEGPREVRTSMPEESAIAPDFARRFEARSMRSDPVSTERQAHARALTGSTLAEALGWIEACGAGRGVEVRFPFFDRRLAELAVSLPPDQKLRGGWSRFAMRSAMEGILPPSIQWREDKADLRPGWAHAYRARQGGRVAALLAEPGPTVERYIDGGRLRLLHQRFLAGTATPHEERMMWRALSLALWLSPADGGQIPVAP
jgi:asparagine synthase (glutamine-hydrolysing)